MMTKFLASFCHAQALVIIGSTTKRVRHQSQNACLRELLPATDFNKHFLRQGQQNLLHFFTDTHGSTQQTFQHCCKPSWRKIKYFSIIANCHAARTNISALLHIFKAQEEKCRHCCKFHVARTSFSTSLQTFMQEEQARPQCCESSWCKNFITCECKSSRPC